MTPEAMATKEKPRPEPGPSKNRREGRLRDGLHASTGRVRPLVLVAEAAGADEGGRRPGALVVGLGAGAVEPGVELRVGDRLAGLVADEVLLVLRRGPAGDRAAAAARVGLDRVLHGV